MLPDLHHELAMSPVVGTQLLQLGEDGLLVLGELAVVVALLVDEVAAVVPDLLESRLHPLHRQWAPIRGQLKKGEQSQVEQRERETKLELQLE